MRCKLVWRIGLIIFIGLATAVTVTAQRIPPVRGVFYYQPASFGIGSQALWNNPAGLGRYHASGFQFMADISDGSYAKSWGAAVQADRMGVAYRYLHKPEGNYKEYIFGAGLPVTAGIFLGGSYSYFSGAPGIYNKRHSWNLSLLSQSTPTFAWAAVFSNLNRSEVDGRNSEIEQRYSIAFRLPSYPVTFAVDMMLSTRTKLSNAEYVYHLQTFPIPGLYIDANIDSHQNFEFGVRANLLKYFVGSQSDFSSGGHHRRTTTYAGATSLRQPTLLPEPGRRLNLSVSGSVPENPPRPVFGGHKTAFTEMITGVYRAAEDPSISEMAVSLKGLSLGFGQAQELREAILFFRSKGKHAICHLSSPNNLGYYVATSCDSILIPPVSQLNLVGLRAELTFYAGTMEKLGIKADILRIGDYKTAPERYTRTAPSEDNREQVNRLLDVLYAQFADAIAEGRQISVDSAKALINEGPFTSAEAMKYGLVDGLSYRDNMTGEYLRRMPEISFRHYRADTLINTRWGEKPIIAVVVAEGDIDIDASGLNPLSQSISATPADLKAGFSRAAAESRVKGIIFRINSPGGLALAGDEIYHAADEAARKKPVVVSMSNVAASGGYYIAMAGERLFADPATITGSIGIYGGKPDLSGLFEKIDLQTFLYTRGKYAGMMSWSRPFTEEEREKYFSQLKAFYEYFVDLVGENRRLPADSIDHLGRGRVWTGSEAIRSGLVDDLGGLHSAIRYMAARLGLKDYGVVIYPERRPLFLLPGRSLVQPLISMFAGDTKAAADVAEKLTPVADGDIYARIPYDITIE